MSRLFGRLLFLVVLWFLASLSSCQECPTTTSSLTGTKFTDEELRGVKINLATQEDSISVNVERWVELFKNRTGIEVRVWKFKSTADLYTELATMFKDKTNIYDAAVYTGQWLPSFANCFTCDEKNGLEDLTERVKDDTVLQWADVNPYFRSIGTQFNGKVYAIPLDGDVQWLWVRKDVFQQYDLPVPRTWDDFMNVTKALHGKDFNGDNITDYASCITKIKRGQGFWFLWTFAAGYLQSLGTSQGAWFDLDTMKPLVKNGAFIEALRMWNETSLFGHPNATQLSLNDMRTLFKQGRCGMTLDWGDIFLQAHNGGIGNISRIQFLPGTYRVFNRDHNEVQDCRENKTLCPYADPDGVNRAPYAANGGWIGSVNRYSNPKQKEAAYRYLSFLSSPEISNVDITKGDGFEMYRIGQFKPEFWIAQNFSVDEATETTNTVLKTFEHKNLATDLRIPNTGEYLTIALDDVLAEVAAGNITYAEAADKLYDSWEALTLKVGRRAMLQVYRKSIGAAPLSEYNCDATGCVNGDCVSNGVCLCKSGWMGSACNEVIPVYFIEMTSGGGVGAISLAAIGALTVIMTTLALLYYRKSPAVQAMSPTFCVLILLGVMFLYGSVFVTTGVPTSATCTAEIWLFLVGFGLVFGNLIARSWRIFKIFNNPRFRVLKLTDGRVLRISLAIIAFEVMIAIIWTSSSPMIASDNIFTTPNAKYYTCSSKSPQIQVVLLSISAAYNFALMIIAVSLAVKSRAITSVYNESQQIAATVYVSTIASFLAFAINMVGSIDPVTKTYIRVYCTIFCCIATTAILFWKTIFGNIGARPTHKHNPSSGGVAPLPSSVGKATDSSAAKSDIRTDSPVFNVHILRDSLLGSWCSGKFVILTDLKVVTLMSDDCTSLVAAIPLSEAEITLKDTGGKSSSVESKNELPYKRLVIKFQRTSYVVEGKSDAVVQACYDTIKAIPVTASRRSGNQTSSKMFSLKTGSVGNPIEPNI